jgi:4-amino-4-deoxy-L-arabinose transferase-like glycosyltransferase
MTVAPKPSSANLPAWVLGLLFLLYALPGTLGHGPWRGDDGAYFGVVYDMLQSGQWLYPSIAGQPFLDNPPLYYWIAALLGKLLGGFMALPDAARLASPLCVAIALYCLARTARLLYKEQADRASVLLGIGLLGLLTHTHEFQPQLALLACNAAAFLGFALLPERPIRGAVIAGLATGLGFLAVGLPALVLMLPLWPILPGICREYRKTSLIPAALLGIGITAVVAALWLIPFFVAQPAIAAAWWAQELADIAPHTRHLARAGELLQLLAWFMWPLWPVAGWTVWRERHHLHEARFVLPLAGLGLAVVLVIGTGSLRPANALPLVPALILLAAAGLPTLRRGAASFLDWFGRMILLALGLFLWFAWYAQQFGWPQPLSRNIARLVPEFAPQFSWSVVIVGALLTLGWILLVFRPPRSPLRPAMSWATGVTFVWTIANLLFGGFVDRDKRYDEIAAGLQAALQSKPHTCIAVEGMGASQLAAFTYLEKFAFETRSSEALACEWLLVYRGAHEPTPHPGDAWNLYWQVERGRRRTAETFKLYRRG